MLEKFRLLLLHWNVAPLIVAAVLCKALLFTLEMAQDVAKCNETSTAMSAAYVGGLFTFAGIMAGILYKVYDSLQMNRKPTVLAND
jgi:hypothetical protein